MATRNDITQDKIKTKVSNQAYREGFDSIFSCKHTPTKACRKRYEELTTERDEGAYTQEYSAEQMNNVVTCPRVAHQTEYSGLKSSLLIVDDWEQVPNYPAFTHRK